MLPYLDIPCGRGYQYCSCIYKEITSKRSELSTGPTPNAPPLPMKIYMKSSATSAERNNQRHKPESLG